MTVSVARTTSPNPGDPLYLSLRARCAFVAGAFAPLCGVARMPQLYPIVNGPLLSFVALPRG